nr:hypothetical protein CTI12_AA462180 [Tanacetum cinerariifolium]
MGVVEVGERFYPVDLRDFARKKRRKGPGKYTCSDLEDSEKCTWSSKGQRMKATGIMWCADHNVYIYPADFVSREEVPTHKIHSRPNVECLFSAVDLSLASKTYPPFEQVAEISLWKRLGKTVMLNIESSSFSWDMLSSLHHTEHSSNNEHLEDDSKALEKNGGREFSAWVSDYFLAYRLKIDSEKLRDLKFEGWKESAKNRWEVLLTHSQMVCLANILDMYYEDLLTLPNNKLPYNLAAKTTNMHINKLEDVCVSIIKNIQVVYGWSGNIRKESGGVSTGELPKYMRRLIQVDSSDKDIFPTLTSTSKSDKELLASGKKLQAISNTIKKDNVRIKRLHEVISVKVCVNAAKLNLVLLSLESAKAGLLVYKKNESIYEEDIKLLKREIYLKEVAVTDLRRKLELAHKQKDEIQLTVKKFKNSSKSLSKLLDCQIVDKCKIGLGYNAVPPLYTGNFLPPNPDLSGLQEFKNEPIVTKPIIKKPAVETSKAKASVDKPKDAHSTVKRPFNKKTTFTNSNVNQKDNTIKSKSVNTARPKAIINAVLGNRVNVVKASAFGYENQRPKL